MANTLKLGNGEWGTKESSLLAYNDENDNFKPLPFDVTRASASSRINKLGLIENVTNNIATIDYQGNVNGSLLTQPQSTNLIIYPVSFGNSYWTKSGASIEGDASTAGSELVTNGDFASGTGWTLPTNTTISGGKLINSNSAAYSPASQALSIPAGTYLFTYTVDSISNGSVIMGFTGFDGIARSTAGTYSQYVTLSSASVVLNIYSATAGTIFTIDNASVKEVQGFTSPSADYTTSAYKLVATTNNGNIYRYVPATTGNDYTNSIWIKRVLGSGTVSLGVPSGAYTTIAVTSEWKRFDASVLLNDVNSFYSVKLATAGDEVLIYGAQNEQLSYPTSLIYNGVEGSTVTRVAELTNQDLSSQVSLTEGVIYIDTTNLGRSKNANIISQNSTVNSIYSYIQTNNKIVFGVFASSVSIAITSSTDYAIGTRTKIAFHYKSGNTNLYVNGSLVGTAISTYTIGSGFADDLRLIDTSSAYTAFPSESIVREFKIYNTGLTSSELIALTTI